MKKIVCHPWLDQGSNVFVFWISRVTGLQPAFAGMTSKLVISLFIFIGLLYPSYVNASTPENKSKLTNFIESAKNKRIQNKSKIISTLFIDVANTDGTLAPKYIEVNVSQQAMYLWENGINVARYRVSTGLYNPTPVGQFKIMNKAKNAFSGIYNVWMPFWMAFYYDPKLNAYFGIHELPYYLSSNGNQIRRPRDFIGTPRTGGCISLDLGEAVKVFDWASIGTPVYVL